MSLHDTQPRLCYAFEQLLHSWTSSPWLLVKAPEELGYLTLLADSLRLIQPKTSILYGGKYCIKGDKITFHPALSNKDNFTATSDVIIADWVEAEQLFGYLCQFNNKISLYPGLVHKANGGVLVVSLHTLLTRPLLWFRLKSIVTKQRFDWISSNKTKPLPVSIPSMPLSLKIVLIGNRGSLAEFQIIEPELVQQAVYSEFEDCLQIVDTQDMKKWCKWVIDIARHGSLPFPTKNAWPVLIREAVRYTGDQKILPLCPLWLTKQLREVISVSGSQYCSDKHLIKMFNQREWRENFSVRCIQDEILLNHVLIETEGERVGQINALSVVKLPGYPREFGEPSRISCVVHIGDGEFTDIEHKAELGGNIHTKGMMIMRAFLMAQLQLNQPFPFSASLTFEQSYSEIDGDSASMAELCALISALANVPISQSIAITGSVDQFGRAQSVGGLNEKIEGFFTICYQRGLTGKQGVIIPARNIHSISLHQDLLDAIKAQQFHVWAIEDITDAILLLTNIAWNGEEQITLIKIIQKRIACAIQNDNKYRYPWPLCWLHWFNRR